MDEVKAVGNRTEENERARGEPREAVRGERVKRGEKCGGEKRGGDAVERGVRGKTQREERVAERRGALEAQPVKQNAREEEVREF